MGLWGILVSGMMASASTAPNVIPIFVGGNFHQTNVAYVSVKICVPGTQDCQVIDHIQLDTGSTGLRIFSSLIRPPLPQILSASGLPMAECQAYGGGDAYFGPIRRADVILNGEIARNIPIQTMDNSFASVPKNCVNAVAAPETEDSNGVLGVSAAPADCVDGFCDGATYFACTSGTCSPVAIPDNAVVPNPIARLDQDNNGILVQFPPIPPDGAAQVTGRMIMGIGTQANNQVGAGAVVVKSDSDGNFNVLFNGKTYWSLFDSGTNSFGLPTDSGVPVCQSNSAPYVCPQTPASLNVSILNEDISVAQKLSVSFVSADSLDLSRKYAFNNLGEEWGGQMNSGFVFGLPFFYGRTIYFAIDGKNNPLGNAAFVGYLDANPFSVALNLEDR